MIHHATPGRGDSAKFKARATWDTTPLGPDGMRPSYGVSVSYDKDGALVTMY